MSHDTSERFKQKLKEQIVFLQNSCGGFDDGNWSEPVRIAASVRVILHDSAHSILLLAHLRAKNINLFTTYLKPPQEDNNGYERHLKKSCDTYTSWTIKRKIRAIVKHILLYLKRRR